ncbi:MAG TPA: hypothetical protein PLA50_13315 [Bacteroidia bacterium]|nr:hypothetical protein [Bacteroidia bacterium]
MSNLSRILVFPLVLGLVSSVATAAPDQGKGDAPKAKREERPRGGDSRDPRGGGPKGRDTWASLNPEQRIQLREALRKVWADPAVISAREEVKQASDAYQAAIKAAVERADPSVAELLAKVQGAGGLEGERRGDGFPGDGAPPARRGFDEQIRPPGFLDSLAPEAREKFRKAEAAAMKSEAVKEVRDELDAIRKEDEALRRKRLEVHRKLRKVTVGEMIRIDPSIEEMQKHLGNGERPRPGDASPEGAAPKKDKPAEAAEDAPPKADKEKKEKE